MRSQVLPFCLIVIVLGSSFSLWPDLVQGAEHHPDVVVYGGTPGGIACAVRAAREGLEVELISPYEHLGGMFANGLSTMDTLYNGSRSPLYDEFRAAIYDYYRSEYGADSPQYQATQPGYAKTRYEAHVAEKLLEQMLGREPNISVHRDWYPIKADRKDRLISSVTFRSRKSEQTWTVAAPVFVDCSYEGDLLAAVGIPYRVGREARAEFDEPHAGIIYVREEEWPPPDADARPWKLARELNLVRYDKWYPIIKDISTGEAEGSVQGYNLRTIITRDPENRVPIEKPENYNPAHYAPFGHGNPEKPGLAMPNDKFGLNHPKLVGEQTPFVEGDWETRADVIRKHADATAGLLYYRQHDESVPAEIRAGWLQYGLPRDEFPENNHLPYEIYARETRRLRGRQVFTEQDAQLHDQLDRAPIHSDSISITEWFLDSHACTPKQIGESEQEGKVMMKNATFPGQVAYDTMLPQNIDNLVVPVCLSTTHVGWGTIRLEPTWMSISEAAALGIVQARQENVTPAEIDVEQLVIQLAERRFLITFFNDIEDQQTADWYPAVQYLGTQGYFSSYNARPEKNLSKAVADAWVELFRNHSRKQDGKESPSHSAAVVLKAEQSGDDEAVSGIEFVDDLKAIINEQNKPELARGLVPLMNEMKIPSTTTLTRGNAARLIFALTRELKH